MKRFFFPRFEWKYSLFLLFFIFSFLYNFIIRWISLNTKQVAQPFLNTYLFNISDYLSIIPFLIVKHRTKAHNISKSSEIESTPTVTKSFTTYREKVTKKNFKFFLIVGLVGLFDCLSHISSLLFYIVYGKNERSVPENNLSSLLIFNIFIIYIFSKLILKTVFYRHHYLSFLMNVICILILGTIDIINTATTDNKESIGMIIFYIIKKIFTIIFYSIEDVIGKKVMITFFLNIYTLLLCRALTGTIIFIIFSIPFIFIKIKDVSGAYEEGKNDIIIFSGIADLLKDFSYKIIFFVLTNFFYNIFIWLIIDNFSPSHYAISTVLESLGTLIRLWIMEPDQVHLPLLRIFIYIILIIAGIIHTEMIVINYCGLEENTKLFLNYLENEDLKLINDNSALAKKEIDLEEYTVEDNNDELNNSDSYEYYGKKSKN